VRQKRRPALRKHVSKSERGQSDITGEEPTRANESNGERGLTILPLRGNKVLREQPLERDARPLYRSRAL
jgi:hypothetical protein